MYISKLWDKKSDINGLAPDKILEVYKITSKNTVGLIIEEGSGFVALVVCNPNMTKSQVEAQLAIQLEAMNTPDPEPEPIIEEANEEENPGII